MGRVLPVYPATEGLSHKVIRGLIDRHLEPMVAFSGDPSRGISGELGLPTLPEAFRAVHRPETVAEAEPGRRRLAFDELLDLQLMLARARLLAKRRRAGVPFEVRHTLTRSCGKRCRGSSPPTRNGRSWRSPPT